jgi:predicted alpha/beta-hydrolase family hydrolase
MEFFAKGIGKRGYHVVRFEYPYMASKRVTAGPSTPSPMRRNAKGRFGGSI